MCPPALGCFLSLENSKKNENILLKELFGKKCGWNFKISKVLGMVVFQKRWSQPRRLRKEYIPDGVWTLIPFKVGPLCLHTFSPPILPLLETPLEVFWNGLNLRSRVPHYLFSTLKTGYFQWRLQFWKQPEVTRSHVWRVVEVGTRLEFHVWPRNVGSNGMSAGSLSWWCCQFLAVRMSGLLRRTASLRHFLAKHGIPVVLQPPYSPDMATYDFWLFPNLKTPLKETRFESTEEDNVERDGGDEDYSKRRLPEVFPVVEGSAG